EKNRLKVSKVNVPSEWVNLVKSTDLKNKFHVNFVDFPLTDDLQPNDTRIAYVKEFKTYFDNFIVNLVDSLAQIRKIKFTKNGIYGTTNLKSNIFEIPIHLIKPNFVSEDINYHGLNNAYNGFLPIKKFKYDDIKRLLNYVPLSSSITIY